MVSSVIAFKAMAAPVVTKDPHYPELLELLKTNKNRRTKAEIFGLWEKLIAPDKSTFTLLQFINWTRNYGEVDMQIEEAQKKDIDLIEGARGASLIKIERDLRGVTDGLVGEARDIMQKHAEDGMPLKERYFALTIVDKIWGKVLKEKELAIKAHAEKRESVGLFAKLLRGAVSGEFTMEDIETLKNNYGGDSSEPVERPAEAAASAGGGAD